jgi:hypothetical protein
VQIHFRFSEIAHVTLDDNAVDFIAFACDKLSANEESQSDIWIGNRNKEDQWNGGFDSML